MQKTMRLLVLSALLALPTTQPAQAAGCFSDCVSTMGCPADDQACADYAREICICACRGYCP